MANEIQEQLIEADDLQICRQLAAGEAPYSQRATALLALDTGATPEKAAAQSGMSLRQVKYWRGRFRNSGLTVFPAGLVAEAADIAAQTTEEPVTAPVAPGAEPEKNPKSKEKKKTKKTEKGSKSKKKDKADKQAQKGKKKSGKGKKRSKKKGK